MRDRPSPNHKLEWPGGVVPEWARPQSKRAGGRRGGKGQQAKGAGKREAVGEVLYNRGVANAAFIGEAMATAMAKHGNHALSGEEMRWGFENLNLTSERLQQMGFAEFMPPLRITCANHEGGGQLRIQQWNGQRWTWASDWITPNQQRLRPLYENSAAQFAQQNNITPRRPSVNSGSGCSASQRASG